MSRSAYIVKVTLIFLALLAAACSKRSDSQAEKAADKTSEKVVAADRDRAREEGLGESAEGRKENEARPSEDDIVEDCHAFVWLTKAISAKGASVDCPQCPPAEQGAEALKFQGVKVERVSCTEDTCEASVSIRTSFNPSNSGTITGGLTGWIPMEQREQYTRGQTPPGEQTYYLKMVYRREGTNWRVVDFGK